MEIDTGTLHADMLKIQRELELIKRLLLAEGELSDWAKEELIGAREEDKVNYTDLEYL